MALFAEGTINAAPHAATAAAGPKSLPRAQKLWEKGALDEAAGAYRAAVKEGGLGEDDLFTAYVRIGVGLAAAGKKRDATEAFRHALELRPEILLPPEAGKKSAAILNDILADKKHPVSPLQMKLDVPPRLQVGERLHVEASVDSAHLPLVSTLLLTADDSLAGHHEEVEFPAEDGGAMFDFPASLSLPSAALVVKVVAKDSHKNVVGTSERHMSVEAAPKPKEPLAALRAGEVQDAGSGRSIWATPWPYVFGGTALLAGGAAAYLLSRPSSDVSLGSVRLEFSH